MFLSHSFARLRSFALFGACGARLRSLVLVGARWRLLALVGARHLAFVVGLRKTPPPKWFQSNPFGGCISATHQIHAVGEGLCTKPFCDCSAAAALVSAAGNTFEACSVAYPTIPAVGDGFLTNTSCGCSAVRVHSQRGR